MKTLTISVADDVYQRASQRAAERDKSLPDVVHEFLTHWSATDAHDATLTPEARRRAELEKLFAMMDARQAHESGSVGPLNREELYERGVR